MRRPIARLLLLLVTVPAATAGAQTPPKTPPCVDSAQALLFAPIYGVGAATIRNACPAFRNGAWADYRALVARTAPNAPITVADIAQLITRWFGPDVNAPAPQPQPTPPPAPDPAGVLLSFAGGKWSNPARVVSSGPIVDWQGSKAIRMQQFSELRWDGLPAAREVYITAEIWIPTSYQPTDRNDKLFRVWGGAYEEGLNDIKVGASSWGSEVGVEYHWSAWPTSEFWGIGQGPWQVPNPTAPFFVPANRERWVTLGFRARVATSANNDGVAEIYVDGKRIAGSDKLPNYPPGAGRKPGYTAGYFLGASSYENPKVTGAIYVRRFTISTGGFAQ